MDFHSRRYTGQEQDPETGLYFYQARYYNPALGQFISPDPIVPEPGNPQRLNRFSYVENNPVNRIDPSGHFSLKKFFKSFVRALAAIVVGIVVGVATAGLGAPAVMAGMLGGASAGGVNTAVNGRNLGLNVLMGAALGGIGAAVGPPLVGGLTQELGSQFAAIVNSEALLGAAFGGVSRNPGRCIRTLPVTWDGGSQAHLPLPPPPGNPSYTPCRLTEDRETLKT
jgi:RHS repeat-associated protein